MALVKNRESESNRIYLSITDGKVARGTRLGKEYFSYVDGHLENIYSKVSTFGNEEVNRWFFELRDGEELYSLCFPYSSGVFKSLILALASDEALQPSTTVRIEPYKGKNGYTKVVVYSDGVKLDWVLKELPEQEKITVGDKEVRDDSKQMEVITSLIECILQRITNNSSNPITK